MEEVVGKQKRTFDDKLKIGLDEKSKEIDKVNEDLLELINKELNNEVNNVVVPFIEDKIEETKNEIMDLINKTDEGH